MSGVLRSIFFFALKIMGVKRLFSESPINFELIRRGDQHLPSTTAQRKFNTLEQRVEEAYVMVVSSKKKQQNNQLLLFIHGGAFVSGPAPHHWQSLQTIVEKTGVTAWLVNYPKAPEFNIQQINGNIDKVYQQALKEYKPSYITLLGDSVGGTLAMSLTQRLLQQQGQVPKQLILITPVFDSSMTNPDIDAIAPSDPMLAKAGVLSAKELCAKGLSLKSPEISPIYGSFEGFPETTLFLGGKDIMYPDGLLGAEKMKGAGVKLSVEKESEMPHLYPLLPLMVESRKALAKIVEIVRA